MLNQLDSEPILESLTFDMHQHLSSDRYLLCLENSCMLLFKDPE